MKETARLAAVAPLYAIADADTWGAAALPDLVESWERLGIRCMQLRAKGLGPAQVERLARECLHRLDPETILWINDHAQIARSVGAAGVHLGQDDDEPSSARRALDVHQWIGRSTHDLEQALAADADPDVDVIAVGPIYETRSKSDPEPAVGLQQLADICSRVSKPVVAIGGIGPDTAAAVLGSGADSLAVIGALRTSDPESSARALLEAVHAASVLRDETVLGVGRNGAGVVSRGG